MMAKKYANKITLPFPPTINSYYRSIPRGKICQSILSAKGREYKDKVRAFLGEGNPTDQRLMMQIKLFMPDKRRRDIDNYLKALLDSLTGIIYNDDSQIDCLAISREEVTKFGKVEITIRGI